MIGSTAAPTLKDLKPIRHHWALLLMTLVCGGFFFAIGQVPNLEPKWRSVVGVVMCAVLALCVAVLGGPHKLFTDWFERNFWGYYWVLRQTAQYTATGEFVNDRHRNRFTWDGWTLYLPVGGWFTRPSFRYRGRSPSSAFRVSRVNWDSMAQVESITVQDCLDNRLTHHPEWFLERVQRLFPNGTPFGSADTMLRLASADAERLRAEKIAVERERDEAREERDVVRRNYEDTVRTAAASAEGTLKRIDEGNRLKTTREGKALRQRLINLIEWLNGRTGVRPTA